MYSPKIAEDLIPALYRISKEKGRPMTTIVDEILRENLASYHESNKQKTSDSSSRAA